MLSTKNLFIRNEKYLKNIFSVRKQNKFYVIFSIVHPKANEAPPLKKGYVHFRRDLFE